MICTNVYPVPSVGPKMGTILGVVFLILERVLMPFLIKRHLCANHCTRARVVGVWYGGRKTAKMTQNGPPESPL